MTTAREAARRGGKPSNVLQRLMARVLPGVSPVRTGAAVAAPRTSRADFQLEAIEPRVLLSADLTPGLSAAGVLGVQLGDGADHLLVQQVGRSADGGVVLDLSLGGLSQRWGDAQHGVTALNLHGGAGEDVFDLRGLLVPVVLDGGAGSDVLTGPAAADTTWRVDGANAGRVDSITFSGVETLRGAPDNRDTFVLQPGGALSGGVDGNAGGYDTLVIDQRGQPDVQYIATGPASGLVVVGGTSTAFDGLEPVTVSADGAGNVSITLTGDANDATLSYDSLSGKLALISNIAPPGLGSFENFLFDAPVGKTLTVNLGFGADRFTVSNLVGRGNFTLVLNDPETVTLSSDVRIDGALAVNAGQSIVVDDGVTVDTGGAIVLTADAGFELNWTAVTPVFQNLTAIASIRIGADARLDGSAITLSSKASNARQGDFEIDEIALQSMDPALLANIFVAALPEGVSVDFADAGQGNPDTITRTDAGGNWTEDGFAIGQTIEIQGTASNNGFFQIAAVSPTVITLTSTAALVNEAGVASPLIEVVTTTSPTTLSFNDNGANPDTITRASGSWLVDGFKQFQTLRIVGTPDGADEGSDGDNDAEYLIAAITDTTITLQAADTLVQQSNLANVRATAQGSPADIPLAVVDPNVSLNGHVALSFVNNGSADQIVRSDAGGSWIADGFAVGQDITVVDTSLNDGGYRIAAVSATTLTLTANATLQAETTALADITAVMSVEGGLPPTGAELQNAFTGKATFGGNTVTLEADGPGSVTTWAGGYSVGQQLSVTGSASNDGFYRITGVAGGSLQVQGTFVAEASTAGIDFARANAQTFSFAGSTITRAIGNWAADGFAVGQQISVEGSLPDDAVNAGINDGGFVVIAISGNLMTLAAPGFAGFLADASQDVEITLIVSQADPLLTFSAAADTITRNTGSWLDDGFVAGRKIVVDGTQGNNAMLMVQSISADGRTLQISFTPGADLSLEDELVRFAEVKGILPNSAVNPANPTQNPTAGSVFSSMAGALPSNILAAFPALSGYFASAMVGEATSSISVDAGADLVASGNIAINAVADANISVKTKGLIVGVTYGKSDANATVSVGAGAVVDAGGNLAIDADVHNVLGAATKVVAGLQPLVAAKFKRLIPGPALGVSYGEANSVALASVADGAQLRGNRVDIGVDNRNDFAVATKAAVKGIKVANLGNALGLAISDVASSADIVVNGDITSRAGDTTLVATSVNLNNDTTTKTSIKRLAVGGAAGKALGKSGPLAGPGMKPAANSGAFGFSGSLSYTQSSNSAGALVGSGADLWSDGNLNLRAYTEDNFKTFAIAGAKLASTVAIGGGVVVSNYSNSANARIDNGAVVDVRGVLSVTAESRVPDQIEIDDRFRELIAFRPAAPAFPAVSLTPPGTPTLANPTGGVETTLADGAAALGDMAAWGSETLAHNMQIIGLVKPFIKHKMIVPALIATTYTQASAGAKDKESGETTKVAVSGSINVTTVANSAKASIGEGARINQDAALAALALQAVAVTARSSIDSIHIAGMTDPLGLLKSVTKLGAAGNKGVNAVGGTYLGIDYSGTAEAWIEDGAQVKAANNVQVDASQHDWVVAVAQSGGVAEKIGITGSAFFYTADHSTRGWVEDGAQIDAGGRVDAQARADMVAISVAGAIESGGAAAVGASVNVVTMDNTTEAFIGNRLNGTVAAGGGSVLADAGVGVLSDVDQQLITVAIAGAFVNGSPSATAGPANAQGVGPKPVNTGGVGVSGAVAINLLDDNTRAFVSGTTLDTTGGSGADGNVVVSADINSQGVAVTGAFTIAKSTSGSIGLAGGFGMNAITRATEAYVADSQVTAGDVVVSARSTDKLVAVTAGAAASKRTGTANVAGSVTVGILDTGALAWIGDGSLVNASGDVSVDGHAVVDIISVAGSVAVGGKAGVGAAVDYGSVTADVQAWIGDAVVNAGDDLAVRASLLQDRLSIAASLAASDQLGLAGAVATQSFDHTVKAELRAGADVSALGDALIDALDDTSLLAIGGSAAFGKRVGFGVAAANINLRRDVDAEVEAGAELDAYAIGAGLVHSAGGGTVTVTGVRVAAKAVDDFKATAAAGAGSQNIALAASAAVTTMDSSVDAGIGAGAQVNRDNLVTAETDQSVLVLADHSLRMLGVAGGLSIGGNVGVGASADVEVVNRHVGANIGAGAQVAARDDVAVEASSSLDALSVTATGAVAYSGGGVAVSGSVGVLVYGNDVRAGIGANAVVDAGDDIRVRADTRLDVLLIDAGISGGGSVGFGGAVGVLTFNNTVLASIGDGASVKADGDLLLSANASDDVLAVAGSLAIGGSGAGVGLSAATLVVNETVDATVGNNAQLEGLGQGSVASVATAVGDQRSTDNTFHGVSVTATSAMSLMSSGAGGAGGGQAGIAGSGGVAVVTQATRARVGSGGSINALDNGTASQGVNVFAASDSALFALGGAVAAGGSAGIGAGAGVVVLTKTTEAVLGGSARAQGHVRVQALSDERIIDVGASAGIGGSVGIAGGAAVATLDLTTRAAISAGADIDADGSVVLAADDQTTLDVVGGSVSGAGTASVGGGAAVVVMDKVTEAVIGQGAQVDARGQSALSVLSGGFALPSYSADASSNGEVAAPTGIADNTSQDDASLSGQRSLATATTAGFRGLSVTATNRDDIETAGVSVGGAGVAAVQLSASVNVLSTRTTAAVGANAQLNQRNNAAAHAQQTVNVAAASDLYHLGISGAGGVSGTASVTPAADVVVLNQTTQALVGAGADVAAKRDIRLAATASQDILSIAVALAGSGGVGVAGAASVLVLTGATQAEVGGGATLAAGGNVVVRALDTTDLDMIAGSVAVGIGGGAAGGGVGVAVVNKSTDAGIANGATVDAAAQGGDEVGLLSGTQAADGSFGTASARGVLVQAESAEDLFGVAASAAVGAFVGLAGAITVSVVDSDTVASIGGGAQINGASSGENAAQSVVVAASNDLTMFMVDGVVAGSIGGSLAGGVDVGIVRNDTSAFIGDSSAANRGAVQAQRDVAVRALADKHLSSTVVAAGGGAVGLAGAVSVVSIGGNFSGSYAYQDNGSSQSDDALSGNDGSFDTVVDGQTKPTALISALGQYGGVSSFGTAQVSGTQIDLASNPGFNTGDAVVYRKGAAGNAAFGGLQDGGTYFAIVDANDPSLVRLAGSRDAALAGTALSLSGGTGSGHTLATASADATQRATAGAAGRLDSGAPTGSVSQAADASTGLTAGTSAFIGSNSDVTAGRHIDLDAREHLALLVSTGGVAGGVVGVGASVAIVSNHSDVATSVRAGSVLRAGAIDASGDVTLDARYAATLDALAIAGGVGGFVGAAGAIVVVKDASAVSATLADGGVQVSGADLVRVNAEQAVTVRTSAMGVAASFYAGAGASVVVVGLDGSATARVGNGAVLGTAGQAVGSVLVQADATTVVDNFPGFAPMAIAIAVAGVGAASGGVALVTNTVDAAAALGQDAAVNASGDVDVLANGDHAVDVQVDGGSLGLAVGIGAVVGRAEISGSTRAEMQARSGGGTAKVKGRHIRVEADGRSDAVVSAVGAAGGLIAAGTGADVETVVKPRVQAHLGSNVELEASGDIALRATHQLVNAEARTFGVAIGGVVSIAVAIADAEASPDVDAGTGTGADLSAQGTVTVRAQAVADNAVVASGNPFAGGVLGAGTGTEAHATASAQVDATIGAGTQLHGTLGVVLEADAENLARAQGESVAVGLVAGVGIVKASATTAGHTVAAVDNSNAFTPGNISGASLSVRAVAEDNAYAKTQAASGGIFSGRGSDATATSTPTVTASIGNVVNVAVSGDVTVRADYLPEADALAQGYGGGVIDAGVSVASSTVSPTVVASVGSGGLVEAGGNVRVLALRQAVGAQPVDGILDVDGVQDSITYGNFNLNAGTLLQYDSSNAIGGLSAGRSYYLLSSTPGAAGQAVLKLGVTFDGEARSTTSGGSSVAYGVDEASDTIRFAGAHLLATGDSMVYDGASGAALQQRLANGSLTGLLAGQKVYVRVIDAQTIKLFNTQALALNPGLASLPPKTAVNGATDTITLNGHGFANGRAVTYRNAVDSAFTANAVDIQLNAADSAPVTDGNGDVIVNNSNTIYFASAHGFATGEAVQYRASGGPAIALQGGGSLVDGGVYYAIKLSDQALRLASNYLQAVGRADDPATTGVDETVLVTPLNLVHAYDDQTRHTLSDPSISGLVAGRTYYVINATANTFQLAAAPAGSAINLALLGDAAAPVKDQFIGSEGLDLVATAGQHRLRVDLADGLSSTPAGTQRLLGAGGVALAQVSPPSGDGVSGAAADASSGGLVAVGDNTAEVRITQDVSATSLANITAGGLVQVQADSASQAVTNTTNANGGVIAVKFADTAISATSSATARLGGTVTAAGAVSVEALNRSSQNAASRTQGGGLVDVAQSAATTDFTPTTLAELATGALVRAGGALAVHATLGANLRASARAQAGGLGADTNADSRTAIITGSTIARVAAGADADAYTVSLLAQGDDIVLDAYTETDAGGVGVDNDADANATLDSHAQVQVGAGALLKGGRGVELLAGHADDTVVLARADGNTDALGGDTQVKAIADANHDATISTGDGSRITAGARITPTNLQPVASHPVLNLHAKTFGTSVLPTAQAIRGGAAIDTGGSTETATDNGLGDIVWDGDVAVSAGASPLITIDAAGTVTTQPAGMEVISAATKVTIGDIGNTVAGRARFDADRIRDSVASSGNDFRQLFDFQDTFDSVTITNASTKALEIRNINTAGSGAPQIDLVAPDVTLTFDLQRGTGPTTITIANTHTAAAPDIILAGSIRNPIGITRISTPGNIVSATDRDVLVDTRTALIETRSLELLAGGAIGSANERVNVDIVQTPGQGVGLVGVAGGNLFLDLEGHLRDPSINASSHQFNLGLLQAGAAGQGSLNLLLQAAVREEDAGGLAGKVKVTTPADAANAGDSTDDLYGNQFRPDDGSPNAPADSMGFYAANPTALDATYHFGTSATVAGLVAAGTGSITVQAQAPTASTAGSSVGVSGTTDITGSGTLTVLTNGDISLTEVAGDLRIASVVSNRGSVALTAAGAAYDTATGGADNGSTAWVVGNSVAVNALGGAVGAIGDFLEINSSNQADGLVDGLAAAGVFLRETTGDMRLGGVAARAGNVALVTLAGAITDGVGDDTADIQGTLVDLLTTGGGIGSASKAVDIYGAGVGQQQNTLQIDSAVPGVGRLVLAAAGASYVRGVGGGLNVLRATTSSGALHISTLDSALTGEDIRLINTGSTQLGVAITSGLVQGAGDVVLQAGDDLLLPAGSLVQSSVSVLLRGDAQGNNPDAALGTTINIQGNVLAPTVEVAGGADIDHLQINSTSGINAGGSLLVRGHGADDRIYLRASAGPTTLQGDEGADRFFLAGNANKALFEGGGVFDDIDPLLLLSGTLGQLGGVVVDAGTGGNGGTVDGLYLSSDAASAAVTGSISGAAGPGGSAAGAVSGFGLPADISYSAASGMAVFIELSNFNDTLAVDAVAATVVLTIDGAAGDDTLNVGQVGQSVADIDGILSFVGRAGFDTLNVHGDASSVAGQLSAVSVTGMGMGSNSFVAVHNDNFGAGYNLSDASWPGAIYYASRVVNSGTESIVSTVEAVTVQLGSGNDTFNIDSVYAGGVTTVRGGDGADTLVVGSTAFGLHPTALRQLNFIAGELHLDGQAGADTLVLDDSGDAAPNTGVYLGNTITGLGITGQVLFDSADDAVDLRLGAGGVTFYVPTLAAGVVLDLKAGTGKDKVVVGALPGQDASGSLANILGTLRIDGQGPEADDQLVLNDRGETTGQTYVVSNVVDATTTLLDSGNPWRFDTTTVLRTGMGAGSIAYRRVEAAVLDAGSGNDTIQLQGTHREQSPLGKNSTFTINAGAGNDTVEVGSPAAGGGHTLAGFFIDTGLPTANSVRGIPVVINGGAGADVVQFLDTASTLATNLAFVNKTFAELFPAATPATGADPRWLALYASLFGDDPQAVGYATVVLNKAGAPEPMNVSSRDTEHVKVSLGSADDITQFFDGVYGYDMTVYAGAGDDTFNIDRGVDNRGHLATLNGEAGDDLAFARFEPGVPNGTAFFQFNGGSHGTAGGAHGAVGDTLRVAGDGLASGSYTPDASTARAGTVTVKGNQFGFSGVEPLIVHGLAQFDVLMPGGAANLAIDSVNVLDLNLTNLVLHTLTVDGVVTWTRQTNLFQPVALETKHAGRATAIGGNTLVVGAELQGSNAGVVYVYTWSGTGWVEQAKLYAPDMLNGGGQGFGSSVAIDGDLLVVGAPEDDGAGGNAGAAYAFVRVGNTWAFEAKLKATGAAGNDRFGRAVAINGNTVLVGSQNGGTGAAYAFVRSGGVWAQQQRIVSSTGGAIDFGAAAALVGNTAVLGAPQANGVGAAYVFTRSGSLWSQQATLLASQADAGEAFGAAVDIDNGRIVVGAPLWDGTADDRTSHGRAFVFEGSGSNWVRVARLTSDAGLTEQEAAGEAGTATSGYGFGSAVAVDGNYVAVGAPGYDGSAVDVGAAYVFYRLPDQGSGNGAGWARSSGESGSGRLMAASPAGTSTDVAAPYNTADRFGTSLALGGGRLVVGMPGYNQTGGAGSALRADVGAMRTFSTNGLLPAATNASLRADALRDPGDALNSTPNAASRFGSVTYYDAANRMLLVSDFGQSKVYVYINEGLSWRLSQTINGNANSGFGADLDIDGNRLVVGAPQGNYAQVFTRAAGGETWTAQAQINGNASTGFGASVAISGDRIVVGMPDANGSYASNGQPSVGYQLNLGATGAAVTYNWNGGVWVQDRLLMPDDNALPYDTSYSYNYSPAGWNQIWLEGRGWYDIGYHNINDASHGLTVILKPWMAIGIADTDDANTNDRGFHGYYNFSNQDQVITINGDRRDDINWMVVGTVQNLSGVYVKMLLGGSSFATTFNPIYHDLGENNSRYVAIGPNTVYLAADWADGWFADEGVSVGINTGSTEAVFPEGINADRINDLDDLLIFSTRNAVQSAVAQNSFGALNGARWGSAVDIVGNQVFVGAAGKSRMAFYDLGQGDFTHWQASIGGITDTPLRSSQYVDQGGLFGTELASNGANQVVVGGPNASLVQVFNKSGSSWFNGGVVSSPGNGGLGANEAIDIAGNRMLVGATSGAGAAYLYQPNGSYLNLALQPYRYNIGANVMENDSSGSLRFGAGVQLVSEGLYLVGTDNGTNEANKLYGFRQRGAAWTVAASDLVPEVVRKAEAGAAVAIDGNTAVVGAPDHDNRGAVFVYTASSATGIWNYSTMLQSADIGNSDRFGAELALSGNALIVGAPDKNSNAGAVYLFQRLGEGWTQKAQFNGTAGARLGSAVAVFGGSAAAGAPGSNLVSLYDFTGSSWSAVQTITGSGTLLGGFGSALAMDQATLLVGAPSANANQGGVGVYTDNGSTWSLQATLTPGVAGVGGDAFGAAVDVSGDTAVVGAPGVSANRGAVYSFTRNGSVWGDRQRLTLATGQANDYFGAAVAIDEGNLLVGAWGRRVGTAEDQGAAYAYHLKNGSWVLDTPIDPITDSGGFAGDQLGYAVAISGQRALIGAPQTNGRSAYVAGAINTDGGGYAFIRDVSPPVTVTVVDQQSELIAGAKANVLTGSVGGVQTADLKFFDIAEVTLTTGGNDDTITVAAGGITAFGLQDFVLNSGAGNDTLNVLSDRLTPPAVGTFVPNGSVGAGGPGSPLPGGVQYVEVTGAFRFDGGTGTNALNANGTYFGVFHLGGARKWLKA